MICPGCLRTWNQGSYCPWCFAAEVRQLKEETRKNGIRREAGSIQIRENALSPGTILHDRYRLGRWIGHGGFGIMYRAMDERLERAVAVKEFFPWKYTTRARDGLQVILPQEERRKELQILRAHFLEEARIQTIASGVSEVPNVYEVFEENHSAFLSPSYADEGL